MLPLQSSRVRIAVVGAVLLSIACEAPRTVEPEAREPAVIAVQGAGQPVTTHSLVPFTFTSSCPQGFDLVNAGTADITETIYFDQSGAPRKTRTQFIIRATSVNSVTGKTLRNDSQFVIFFDVLTGEISTVGGSFHFIEPGRGIVVRDAGKITFDAAGNVTFEAGTHDFTNGDSTGPICEALAG